MSRGGEEGAPGRGTLPCSHSPPVSLCQGRKGMALRADATRLASSSLRRRHGHLLPAAATSFSTPLFLAAPSLVACLPLTVRLIPRQDSSRGARMRRASWLETEKMFRRGAAGGAAEVQGRCQRSRRGSEPHRATVLCNPGLLLDPASPCEQTALPATATTTVLELSCEP